MQMRIRIRTSGKIWTLGGTITKFCWASVHRSGVRIDHSDIRVDLEQLYLLLIVTLQFARIYNTAPHIGGKTDRYVNSKLYLTAYIIYSIKLIKIDSIIVF